MSRQLPCLFAWGLMTLAGCNGGPRTEIALPGVLQRLAAGGLRLVDYNGSNLPTVVLFPFRADPRESLTVGVDKYGVSLDGRAIILVQDGRVLLVDEPGVRPTGFSLPRKPLDVRISADRKTIAYSCPVPESDNIAYFVNRTDFPAPWKLAEEQGRFHNGRIEISSTGTWVTFVSERKVFAASLADRRIFEIGRGESATVSPDGGYIAISDLNKAILYNTKSGSKAPLLSGHKIRGPLRWSPDGRFILFAEQFTHLRGGTRLVVLRMSDGATHPVLYPALDVGTEYYGWYIRSDVGKAK